MRRLLSFWLGIVLLTVHASAADRPNILLCVADDWGWPHASAYGDPAVRTPAFDRLAREGVLFDHAFVSSPSCTPSRSALLTGQPFYRLGEGANLQSTLSIEHPNFMRLLEANGYAIGHWRKVWGPGVYEAGGYKEHPCGPESDLTGFLKRRPKGAPFCFFLGAYDPHRPYDNRFGEAAGIDRSKIRVPSFLPDNDVTRRDLADYYGEVERWDRDVAKAIEQLEAAGELENTIIVMTGDNGMPFPRAKGNLYDHGARVPLAIRGGAGMKKFGGRTRQFVSQVDLAPTFLVAAGVEVPTAMTGRSLLPLLKGAADESRGYVITGRERHAAAQEMPSLAGYPSRAIRTHDYLYIMNLEPDRWPAGVPDNATHPNGRFPDCDDGPTKSFIIEHAADPACKKFYDLCFARRPAEELYAVEADPEQVRNLAAMPEHADLVRQLRERLTADLRATGDPRFTGEQVKFDDFPYRDERVHKRINAWREKQGATTKPIR